MNFSRILSPKFKVFRKYFQIINLFDDLGPLCYKKRALSHKLNGFNFSV